MMDCREEVIRMPVQFLELEQVGYSECLCESIRRAGIIMPFIVGRRETRYQVVLGRARLQAAQALGLEKVPVIIRNLNDSEVRLLQIEEAVTQKAFCDRRFSERVVMISSYYELVKAQGVRTDLVQRVRKLTEDVSGELSRERYDSSVYVKRVFGISGRTLNRYMKLQNVCQKIMECLDEGSISLRSAVELSYLSKARQGMIMQLVQEQKLILKFEQAAFLRRVAETETFGKEDVLRLLRGTKNKSILLKVDGLLVKYNLLNYSPNDIYLLLDNALGYYLEGGGENTNKEMGVKHI